MSITSAVEIGSIVEFTYGVAYCTPASEAINDRMQLTGRFLYDDDIILDHISRAIREGSYGDPVLGRVLGYFGQLARVRGKFMGFLLDEVKLNSRKEGFPFSENDLEMVLQTPFLAIEETEDGPAVSVGNLGN